MEGIHGVHPMGIKRDGLSGFRDKRGRTWVPHNLSKKAPPKLKHTHNKGLLSIGRMDRVLENCWICWEVVPRWVDGLDGILWPWQGISME